MKNRIKKVIFFLVIGIVLWLFSLIILSPWTPPELRVSQQQVQEAILQDDIQIIDLRTLREVKNTGIIPTAIHIDYYQSDFKERLAQLDTSKSYIVYCYSWVRSRHTLAIMQELWLSDVRDYAPWIIWWLSWGNKTVPY